MALPIFPGRRQPSIVGRSELNFRVRDGNGWTLALISTNFYCNRFPCNKHMIHFLSIFPINKPAKRLEDRNGKAAEGVSFGLQTEANDPQLALTWYTFRDSNPGHPD